MARLVEPVDGYDWVARPTQTDVTYQLGTPVDFNGQLLWVATIRPANGKRFPYGLAVEPD